MIKRFIPFIFAGILGLVAVVLLQKYLQDQKQALVMERQKLLGEFQSLNPKDLIVAKTDLPVDTKILIEHLEKRSVPAVFHQPYSTANAGDLLGLLTRVPVAKGEQMMTNKLRREQDAPVAQTLSGATPQGMRAVTIGSDVLTGVGGFVRPGDKIDILWLFQPPVGPGQQPDLVTMTLFQNVSVLAVGGEMVGKPTGADKEAARDYTVTLSLTPQQTSVLLYAREQGRIQLSLRSKAEKAEAVAVLPADFGTVMESVLGEGAMPKPTPQRAQHTVEVIRGLEHDSVSIEE